MIELAVREGLVRLEVLMGEILTEECERGLMNEDQLDAILDFFARLDEHDESSATAWLDAWLTWRDTTHLEWREMR